MEHKRSLPWLHRWSRFLIGGLAGIGMVETAFLTFAEMFGKAADVCPTQGCKEVLESPYAMVFGVPLTLFGFIAYTSVTVIAFTPILLQLKNNKSLRSQLEDKSWLLLLVITTTMVVSSGYLMSIMAWKIEAFCPYCIISAILSLSLFVLTLIGRYWEDSGQVFFICLIVGVVGLIGVLGVYANVDARIAGSNTNSSEIATGESGPPITTVSGPAEMALAKHLTKTGAKIYTAYTCPHCHEQKQLLGKEAVNLINNIECNPRGKNARPELCQAAGLRGVPTWEINGTLYAGVQPLERLADLSGYEGSRDFKYEFPY
ncbi:MAG: vitamin K epoxide reductase family protein [Okeania sp. SIO2H7]|nr:vitamin K epoxide reductase family protein [Okeania sp. SIO2H7]